MARCVAPHWRSRRQPWGALRGGAGQQDHSDHLLPSSPSTSWAPRFDLVGLFDFVLTELVELIPATEPLDVIFDCDLIGVSAATIASSRLLLRRWRLLLQLRRGGCRHDGLLLGRFPAASLLLRL